MNATDAARATDVAEAGSTREVAKYPPEQKQSAVMAALTIAQDEKGWLSTETMDFVAQYLGMPPVAVYEVATFYTMYNLKPIGQYKLTHLHLPAVRAAGRARRRRAPEARSSASASTRPRPTAAFTLKEGECMGACGDAPVLLVNNKTDAATT